MIGCAERRLEVPLFTELYGYGPFQGRRNLGEHDPLYCRAFSFFDGRKRSVFIYTDACTTDDRLAAELRAELAEKYNLDPDGVAFIATHTHSGPCFGKGSIGFGTMDWDFVSGWLKIVVELVGEALENEEIIASADCGKAIPAVPHGVNRIDVERNLTDPCIRYARFRRPDGTVKVLLHNHGVHGVSCNGPIARMVSADWMGAVNRLLKEKGICDMPFFMQGPAGDINTSISEINTPDSANIIAKNYVADLENAFAESREIPLGSISFVRKNVEFPVKRQTVAELRKDMETLRSFQQGFWDNAAIRLEEMATLLENGLQTNPTRHDLQIIRIGELMFKMVPGEPFMDCGLKLLQGNDGVFPMVATLANGNGGYIFTEECAKVHPTIDSRERNGKIVLFGYYELYGYMHGLRFKYVDDIADFVVNEYKKLEKALP